MLPRLGFTQHAQAGIMRIVLCRGFVGLLFPAIVAFGPFPTVQTQRVFTPTIRFKPRPRGLTPSSLQAGWWPFWRIG